MVSSPVGSSTSTLWNLRASAPSFSIVLRYSAMVVAPMTCNSPRARRGFMKLAASTAPSAAPIPIMVCSSSIKRMTSPAAATSSITERMRSSKSPRYLVPATMAGRSSVMMRLSARESGTRPSAMRWASPSTTAVLPTPASPMRQGLFLERRERICKRRSVSRSRPITGSSFPSRACSVSSRPKRSSITLRVWRWGLPITLGGCRSLFCSHCSSRMVSRRALHRPPASTPSFCISCMAPEPSCPHRASKRCSVPACKKPPACASRRASSIAAR